MHKFTLHFIDGNELEVHFDGANDSTWRKFMDGLRPGVLEVMYCERVKDFIRIRWENVKYIIPVKTAGRPKKVDK